MTQPATAVRVQPKKKGPLGNKKKAIKSSTIAQVITSGKLKFAATIIFTIKVKYNLRFGPTSIKKEEIYRNTYRTFEEANIAIFKYIEGWYNRKRLHSSINYMTPDQCELLARSAA